MTTQKITAPVGCWWLDDGADSGVWPVEVESISIFGVTVRGTHPNGPYFNESITVPRVRVYDSQFNRPAVEP